MPISRDVNRKGNCVADFILNLHADKDVWEKKKQEGEVELILMLLEMNQ